MSKTIHFDEAKHNDQKQQFKELLNHVQSSIDCYNKLGYSKLNNEEVQKLFTDTEELIFDKMTEGKETSIAGLELHKHKALEMFKKPVGYEELIQSVKSTNDTLLNHLYSIVKISKNEISYYFILDENGVVDFTEKFLSSLEARHTFKATSEKAKLVLEFAQIVIDKANELGIVGIANKNPNGFGRFISDIIECDHNKEPKLNIKGIMQYNNAV